MREVRVELKKVTWPTRQEVFGTTIVVLVAVVIFGVFLYIVDIGLNFAITRIFNVFST